MSFSQEVKEELSRVLPAARHCQIAELAAIISMCGRIVISARDRYSLKIHTENPGVAKSYRELLCQAFHVAPEVAVRTNRSARTGSVYTVTVNEHDQAVRILQAVKLLDENEEIGENLSIVDNVVIMKDCCKRAFLRGVFMASGSISDPGKSYHFEIVCETWEKAQQLSEIIKTFKIDSKIVERKKHFVVYIKEGEGIVDILNVMQAHISLMNLENVRILKEM